MKLKQITAAFLAVLFVLPQTGFADTKLSDIAGNANEKAIKALEEQKVIQGDETGKFMPDKSLTRAEACVMLVKAFFEKDEKKIASEGGSESKFSDVASTYWGNPYLNYAKSKGMLSGYADGTAKPENPVSKEEMLALVMRASKIKLDENVADWKAAVLKKAEEENLLADTAKDQAANKGFAAQIIYNAVQKIGKSENEPKPNETKPAEPKPGDVPAAFSPDKLKYGEATFSEKLDKYGDMALASDVKVYAYGESKNYKKDMKLPSLKDLTPSTIYKYKDAKAKAFYIEENGKIKYMLLPKDAGFSGSVYCVINGTHSEVSYDGQNAQIIESLTAGKAINWECKQGLTLKDDTKYADGNFVKLLVDNGIVKDIVPLLDSDSKFKVLTKVESGESKWEKVEKTDTGVLILKGNKYIATKTNPTVYKFSKTTGKYTTSAIGSIRKDMKVKAFDIEDDKEDSADLLIIR